ncbi:MAG TPA: DUF4296 domain-containing protein [Flavisolibacter sp.]|jgi:hypothetical protein|nr:DUF4296 domain-containing protein [Flavisolibacter sp.]
MRILALLSFFVLSCAQGTSVPEEILPPPKMEAVLYDVISADELADFSVMRDSTYRVLSKRTSLYDSIFSFHSIDKESFKKSLQFYQGRPDLLKKIFDSLQKRSDTAIAVQTRADTSAAQKKRRDTTKLKPVMSL